MSSRSRDFIWCVAAARWNESRSGSTRSESCFEIRLKDMSACTVERARRHFTVEARCKGASPPREAAGEPGDSAAARFFLSSAARGEGRGRELVWDRRSRGGAGGGGAGMG